MVSKTKKNLSKKLSKNSSKNIANMFKLKNLKNFNIKEFFDNLSKSKLFIGLMMIFMNILLKKD